MVQGEYGMVRKGDLEEGFVGEVVAGDRQANPRLGVLECSKV
jgi:hypothetical protein